MEDEKFVLIDSGIELIDKLLKGIKKPADANSKKEISEGLTLLRKKVKLMRGDEALCVQYLDRTKFDTIQGLFQALHLYIISTEGNELIDTTVEWLRDHENCYVIADRMQKAALARTDFNTGKK